MATDLDAVEADLVPSLHVAMAAYVVPGYQCTVVQFPSTAVPALFAVKLGDGCD